jgi:hypothetical protein
MQWVKVAELSPSHSAFHISMALLRRFEKTKSRKRHHPSLFCIMSEDTQTPENSAEDTRSEIAARLRKFAILVQGGLSADVFGHYLNPVREYVLKMKVRHEGDHCAVLLSAIEVLRNKCGKGPNAERQEIVHKSEDLAAAIEKASPPDL